MKKKEKLPDGTLFPSKTWRTVILIALVVLTGIFTAKKIDLTNSDLGRHIVNGKIFLENLTPVKSNYYSCTEPDYPVVNHHWGTGVIYALVYTAAGFTGLSLLNVLLFSATVLLFFRMGSRRSTFFTALFFTLLVLPLVALRSEIRPEVISYLFCGITYYLLTLFSEGKNSFRRMLIYPLLMLLWVNLHIFFIYGLFLLCIFLTGSIISKEKEKIKQYLILLGLSVTACLINPSGIKGLTEPFLIFREYGYKVAENQSLFFMQGRFPDFPQYIHTEILTAVFALLLILAWVKYKRLLLPGFIDLMVFLFFLLTGYLMVRGLALAGLFFIPAASGLTFRLLEDRTNGKLKVNALRVFAGLSAVLLLFFLFYKGPYFSAINPLTGMGWSRQEDGSGRFFKENAISGPLFNNYDIGGYLIFHLFPHERVFVDNRPEAYSVSFFKEIYEPMQASEDKWAEIDAKYHFNAIFFNRLDNTEHAQPFLIRRIADPDWEPVFVDGNTLILLRKNERNAAVIAQYALPKSMFTATQ